MLHKHSDKNIGQKNYLIFLKHYSTELKFMSPWTQIDNTDYTKAVNNINNVTKNIESQNQTKKNSLCLPTNISNNIIEHIGSIKHN